MMLSELFTFQQYFSNHNRFYLLRILKFIALILGVIQISKVPSRVFMYMRILQ
jgi:hypothetical protein